MGELYREYFITFLPISLLALLLLTLPSHQSVSSHSPSQLSVTLFPLVNLHRTSNHLTQESIHLPCPQSRHDLMLNCSSLYLALLLCLNPNIPVAAETCHRLPSYPFLELPSCYTQLVCTLMFPTWGVRQVQLQGIYGRQNLSPGREAMLFVEGVSSRAPQRSDKSP